MLFAQFQSSDPFDHVPRVLGQLERMGFILQSLSVNPGASGLSEIKVVYHSIGCQPAETLAHRIAQLKGIQAFQHGNAS